MARVVASWVECSVIRNGLFVIILMSYLPVLKSKAQSQFTNPLAGFVYDNKKYADSCL